MERKTRASSQASAGSSSRDIPWDRTVGVGLEECGDLGTPGQEWSGGGPGVACESSNLVESKREGNVTASGDSSEEGKEAVRKGIATGCKETALTDQQVGVNPYCNQSKPQIQLQNATSIIDQEA